MPMNGIHCGCISSTQLVPSGSGVHGMYTGHFHFLADTQLAEWLAKLTKWLASRNMTPSWRSDSRIVVTPKEGDQ